MLLTTVVKAKINQLLWWLEGLRQEVMDEVFRESRAHLYLAARSKEPKLLSSYTVHHEHSRL